MTNHTGFCCNTTCFWFNSLSESSKWRGGERHGIPFSLTSFHIVEEARRMDSKDVGGGQQASLAFLWSPRPLWRCPPAPFTFEFLSRPSRSAVKYILKSYEFMNFAQVYLSASPHHQGEACIVQKESSNLQQRGEEREREGGRKERGEE